MSLGDATKTRRSGDGGLMCRAMFRFNQCWDVIDDRDLDKHAMAWAIFWMTSYITNWGLNFVWIYPDKPGLEVAATLGAVIGPWSAVQLFVIKWYFETNTGKVQS